eukprot:Platyproteum_vivax@DN5564_c0_g1_i1.p1
MFTSTYTSSIPLRSTSPAPNYSHHFGLTQAVSDPNNRGFGRSPGYHPSMVPNVSHLPPPQGASTAGAPVGQLPPPMMMPNQSTQYRSVTPTRAVHPQQPQTHMSSLTPPPTRTGAAAPVSLRSRTPPANFNQTTPIQILHLHAPQNGSTTPPQVASNVVNQYPGQQNSQIRSITPKRISTPGDSWVQPFVPTNQPRQSIVSRPLTPPGSIPLHSSNRGISPFGTTVVRNPLTPPSHGTTTDYTGGMVSLAPADPVGVSGLYTTSSVRPARITTTIQNLNNGLSAVPNYGSNTSVTRLQNENTTMRSQMYELEHRIRLLETRLQESGANHYIETQVPIPASPSPERSNQYPNGYPKSGTGPVPVFDQVQKFAYHPSGSGLGTPGDSPSNRFEWKIQDIVDKMNSFQPGEFLHSTDFAYQGVSGYQLRFFPNEEGPVACRFGIWCPTNAPKNKLRLFLGSAMHSERDWLRETSEGIGHFCCIEFSREEAEECAVGASLTVGVEFLD